MEASAKTNLSEMQNKDLPQIDGIIYPTFGLIHDLAKQMELMRKLELSEDDVICVGFPRTGNHLLLELVSMVQRQDAGYSDQLVMDVFMEVQGDNLHEIIQKMPSPRYLATHLRVNRIPLQAIEKRLKLIYPMRNPKDILISLYRLMSSFKEDKVRFQGSWDNFFELQIKGEFQYGFWFDHVLKMEKFMEEHPECPVYIFLFEKFIKDRMAVVKELCSFLGKPDTLAEEIANVTGFKDMKKKLFEGKMKREEELFQEGTDALFRSGTTGGWKNYFTVAQSERFDRAFEKKLNDSKLAQMVREFLY